jgi:hypothetical protein
VREQSTGNNQQSTTNEDRLPTNQQTNQPATIWLEISARGNWRQAVKQSLKIAGNFPGNDHLHIRLAEQPDFTMSFPNNPTQAGPTLLGRLRNLADVVDAKIT